MLYLKPVHHFKYSGRVILTTIKGATEYYLFEQRIARVFLSFFLACTSVTHNLSRVIPLIWKVKESYVLALSSPCGCAAAVAVEGRARAHCRPPITPNLVAALGTIYTVLHHIHFMCCGSILASRVGFCGIFWRSTVLGLWPEIARTYMPYSTNCDSG